MAPPKIPDSDDDMVVQSPAKPASKPSSSKPSASTSTASKKRKSTAADVTLSSDASDEDVKPPPKKKSVSAGGGGSTTKKASVKTEDQEDQKALRKKAKKEDEEMEDVKPKKKAVAGPKASSSNAPAKKAKKEVDDDEEEKPKPKPKWPFKGKSSAGPTNPGAFSPSRRHRPEFGGDASKSRRPSQLTEYRTMRGAGSKEIPIGEDNCLAGLTFVFTGELDSLSREEGQDLVKRYGGWVCFRSLAFSLDLAPSSTDTVDCLLLVYSRVTTAPSSKTSYVVLGADAGPKKLEMIKKHRIKTVDEDGFLALIAGGKSQADDPKVKEAKRKEQEKVKEAAKQMGLTKDAPEHLTQLWTTKYAPQKLTDICGNKSSVEKLNKWLELWPKSLASDFKKPGPDAMGTFRCVLISGPPGIGKTTSAHLVAKMQGYDVLELNASDTRSKKLLEEGKIGRLMMGGGTTQAAFKSKISDTTLSGFFKKGDDNDGNGLMVNRKSLIIMDEVDGMSAGDRGGVGALNALIKKTKVPIIAICNDKGNQKMKPLMATCYQMGFRRRFARGSCPSRSIISLDREGLKLDGKVVDQLVQGSQSDIRQIVNMLSTYKLGAKAMDYDQSKKLAKMNEKNALQTPWTLYSKLFGPQAGSAVSGMTLNDKLDVYFQDFNIMPLFVQENYLKGRFSRASGCSGNDLALKNLDLMSRAADAISDGDLVDAMIHGSQQQWSLMPLHGMMSCVRPASLCYGQGGQPNFPAWFGKYSTQGKLSRMLGEIQIRMRLRVSGDRREIRQSYLPTLFPKLVQPLIEEGSDAIPQVMELMDDYYLTKEDWDAIVELGIGEGFTQDEVLKLIPTATKGAFTRKYNSSDHPIPFYKPDGGKAKAKKLASAGEAPDLEEAFVDEDDLADEDDDGADTDDSEASIGKDKLIRNKAAKKGAAAKPKTAAKKAPAKPRKKKSDD
ncbi:SPOSA6832_02363 [Sporobolomyces salmonicolor]|uniref:Replication factor C subunit 1 n=1 Tax=Sporidiobolus salmonicolor TaxID=5005 RepID=A0A0D6EL64_SPOSA|nr:SPOSA6832_02363 [Sporobolomyces salmonicolor]